MLQRKQDTEPCSIETEATSCISGSGVKFGGDLF